MRKRIRTSILAKLFLGTTLTMLIPFIVVNLFIYRMNYQESLQRTINVNEEFLGIGLDLMDEYLRRIKGLPLVIYENPAILNALQKEEPFTSEEIMLLRRELGGMIRVEPSVRMITVDSGNGDIITQEEIGSDNEKRWREARYGLGDGMLQSGYDEYGFPTVLRYTMDIIDVPFPDKLARLTFYSVPDTMSAIARKVGANEAEGVVVRISVIGEETPLYKAGYIEEIEFQTFGEGYVTGTLNGQAGFFFIGHSRAEPFNIEIMKFVPEQIVTGPVFQLLLRVLALQGIILMCMFLFVLYIYRIMIVPIKNIASNIDKVQEGEYQYVATSKAEDEVGILDHKYAEMVGTINNLVNEKLKSALEISKTRLKMLQAQINPHFLNNMLQTISTQALRAGDKEVSVSITMLARIFQYTIDTSKDFVPLSMEIGHIERYLNLQQARFREKLDYEIYCQPNVENTIVPKMILQPLVENSLHHGLTSGDEGGFVKIRIFHEGEYVVIQIIDNGSGFSQEKIESIRKDFNSYEITPEAGHGIGFLNVLQRLDIYADEFTWNVESIPWVETTVTLRFKV